MGLIIVVYDTHQVFEVDLFFQRLLGRFNSLTNVFIGFINRCFFGNWGLGHSRLVQRCPFGGCLRP